MPGHTFGLDELHALDAELLRWIEGERPAFELPPTLYADPKQSKLIASWLETGRVTLATPGDGVVVLKRTDQYRPDDKPATLSFGRAIDFANRGYRIARLGWNGKNMWVAQAQFTVVGMVATSQTAKYLRETPGAQILPCLVMRAADGSIVAGWLASQTDMLTEDWMIVPWAFDSAVPGDVAAATTA